MNGRLPPAELEAALQGVIADPGNARYPEVAVALVAAGRFAEAIQVAEQGLAVQPSPEGQLALADANLQLGRTEHAQVLVERLLAAAPRNLVAMRVLGECHLRSGRPDLAAPLLARAAAALPPDPRAVELLAAMPPAAAAAPAVGNQPAPELSAWDDAGPLELDTGSTPDPPSPAPELLAAEEAPLELDLGEPTSTQPPATSSGSPGAQAPVADPAPAPPRPASSPALPMASARRSSSGTGGSRLQPYAPPHLARERRRKMMGVVALLLLAAGGGGGFLLWKRNLATKARAALGLAELSAAQDTAASLASAEASVQEGLAFAPESSTLLGLGAYIAARRVTAFEASADVLITAQERIARAEVLPQVDVRARVAQAMLLQEQNRFGEVIDIISTAQSEGGTHPGLLWVRAQAEWKLTKIALAVESLEKAHAAAPDFLPIVPTLAAALVASDRSNDAFDLLLRVVEAHPEHLPSVILLLDRGISQKKARADLLERAVKIETGLRTSATPTEICRFNLAAARLAMAAGDADQATRFENGASAAEADATCREALGFALLDRARPCSAADVLAGAAEGFAPGFSADAATRARRDRVLAATAALRCRRSSRAEALVRALPEGDDRKLLEIQLEIADGRLAAAKTHLDPLLKPPGGGSAAWAVAARLAIARGDAAAARRAALRAAARPGQDPRQRLELARLLLDVGEARKAAALLPAPHRRRHPSHALLALRGEALLLGSHRAGPGLNELERAIAMNPDADRAVRVYLARTTPTRLSRLTRGLGAAQASGIRLAAALLAGDLQSATTVAEAQPETKVEPLRLSLGRGLLQVSRGEVAGLKHLQTLQLANRARPEASLALAKALHRLGKLGDAVTAFEMAIELAPGDARARLGWAEAQVDGATQPDDALTAAVSMLAWVERLVTTRRQLARAHAALAIARAELNDRKGARAALARALSLARDEPRVRYADGRVLEAGGEIRKALGAYQAAGRLPGGEIALLRLGVLGADGLAPVSVARPALERFLELQPGHAQAGRARQILAALP